MRIQKKRVRNLECNLVGVSATLEVMLAAPLPEVARDHMTKVGFAAATQVGEKVLPAVVGPISRFNAEGSFIKHRDQPMETCYRQHKWTYKQWHGQDTVEVTDFVDVPYKRYPRTLIPPPSVELLIVTLPDGRQAIATASTFTVNYENPAELRHVINLMLELFGFCDVIDKNLLPVGVAPVVSLNWKVLPLGEMPWTQLEPHLKPVLDIQKKGKRPVVEHRLKEINRYSPTFVAVGHGGFTGYVIFGFRKIGLYVLECARYGNATYVLEEDWKELSKLTKAEILNQQRHKARLVHIPSWETRVGALLHSTKEAV